MSHARSLFIIILFSLLSFTTAAQIQPPQPASEFLYRKGTHLFIYNTNAQQVSRLSGIEIEEGTLSKWVWSPNGKYLLADLFSLNDAGESRHVLRVYDTESREWVADIVEAPAQNVFLTAEWSPDGSSILYGLNDNGQGSVWRYTLATGAQDVWHQTPEPKFSTETWGIIQLWWSPLGRYALFTTMRSGFEKSLVELWLVNFDQPDSIFLLGDFNAVYNPIWSPNGEWFLLLRNDTGYNSYMNVGERGDIYVYSARDGSAYQATSSSGSLKVNLEWLSGGQQIQYSDPGRSRTYLLNLQDVLDNQDKPWTIESIQQGFYQAPENTWLEAREMVSPDYKYTAYLTLTANETYNLNISLANGTNVQIVESLTGDWELIGWRP